MKDILFIICMSGSLTLHLLTAIWFNRVESRMKAIGAAVDALGRRLPDEERNP